MKLAVVGYDTVREEYPTSLVGVDAIIVSGSPNSAYQDLQWIKVLTKYIASESRVLFPESSHSPLNALRLVPRCLQGASRNKIVRVLLRPPDHLPGPVALPGRTRRKESRRVGVGSSPDQPVSRLCIDVFERGSRIAVVATAISAWRPRPHPGWGAAQGFHAGREHTSMLESGGLSAWKSPHASRTSGIRSVHQHGVPKACCKTSRLG